MTPRPVTKRVISALTCVLDFTSRLAASITVPDLKWISDVPEASTTPAGMLITDPTSVSTSGAGMKLAPSGRKLNLFVALALELPSLLPSDGLTLS